MSNVQNNVSNKSAREEQENNEKWIKGCGFVIVAGVAFYAEVAFLSVIGHIFPNNPIFKFGATLGAVATGLSCVVLILAKLKWIRAGSQSKWSWTFLAMEIGIMAANTTLAYQLSTSGVQDWMQMYYQISPATPLVAFIGWILLFMTDQQKAIDDKRRKALDEMKQAETDHELEQHNVLLSLKRDILHVQADHMRREVEVRRPEIERATSMLVSQEITALLGAYIPPTSGNKTVQGSGHALPLQQTPAKLAQTASLPAPKQEPAKPGLLASVANGVMNAVDAVVSKPDASQPTRTARTRPVANTQPRADAIHAKRMDRLKRQHQKPLTPAQEDMKQKIRESVQPTNPQTALPTNQANGQSRKVKQLPPMKY